MVLFHENVADVNTQMNVNMLFFRMFCILQSTSKVCKYDFCVFTLDLQTELADIG